MIIVFLLVPILAFFLLFAYSACRVASQYDQSTEQSYREQAIEGVIKA